MHLRSTGLCVDRTGTSDPLPTNFSLEGRPSWARHAAIGMSLSGPDERYIASIYDDKDLETRTINEDEQITS